MQQRAFRKNTVLNWVKNMKLVSKSDILYTVTIGAAALALFFALSLFGGNTVKITMQGKTIYEGSISQNDTVTVEGDYTNIIKNKTYRNLVLKIALKVNKKSFAYIILSNMLK